MKMLVVDDSVFTQKIMAGILKKNLESPDLYFASDGQEGLEKYQEIQPDYVFVDLLMPVMDGQTLIPLIQKYDRQAKIIVVSADIQKNVREEIEKYHVMAFISKPFNDEKAQDICRMIKEQSHEQ
jgi:two-component system chemotaxis response regulator CheY